MRQRRQMIDGVAAIVHRIAQNDAEFAGKGIGDYGLALDQAGVAVAGFLPWRPPVDQNDVTAALLQMQRHAHPDNSRSKDDHVCAGAHRSVSPVTEVDLGNQPNPVDGPRTPLPRWANLWFG